MSSDPPAPLSSSRAAASAALRLRTGAALILLALFLTAVNISAGILLRAAKIDLTERRLYTLSEGTIRLISNLEEDMTLRLFFSRRQAAAYPALLAQGTRVSDLLREMAGISGGRITLEIIDPDPFSAEEDRALAYAMRGIRTEEGALLYFGLAGANRLAGEETIPFFTPEREDYLEYDLARLIDALSRPRKPALGLVTSLPFDTGAGGLPAAMRGRAKPFALYSQLIARFRVEFLEQEFRIVPPSIRVLMVAHPKPLSEETLYALDQFVMRGGRLLLFLDPWSELSRVSSEGETLRGARTHSDLAPLLEKWGILYAPDEIVIDRALAMRVGVEGDPRAPLADYVLWLSLGGDNMDEASIVTSALDRIHLASAGRIRVSADYGGEFQPLLRSSADSMILPRATALENAEPQTLLRDFRPDGARHILGARLSGAMRSAFAEPPPAPADEDDAPPQEPLPEHIPATENARMILIADSDLFDDRFWVLRRASPSGEVFEPIADNAKLVMNAIDQMMGSDALIGLRARERARRPFTRMDALRAEAEGRFLEEARALREKVAEMERTLAQAPEAAGAEGGAEMREALLESRRALRETQRKLRADIDALTNRLLFLNIALMPLLASLLALGVALARRFRAPKRDAA